MREIATELFFSLAIFWHHFNSATPQLAMFATLEGAHRND
jgi:hypothetical protein